MATIITQIAAALIAMRLLTQVREGKEGADSAKAKFGRDNFVQRMMAVWQAVNAPPDIAWLERAQALQEWGWFGQIDATALAKMLEEAVDDILINGATVPAEAMAVSVPIEPQPIAPPPCDGCPGCDG